MTTDDFVERDRIDIGQVLQNTFGVLSRNALVFFLLALLLAGVPSALLGAFNSPANALDVGRIWPRFGTLGLLGIVTNAILQGAIIHGTVQDLNGRPVVFAESLANGLRSFLPLIGLSILMGLAIVFGLFFLFVPGVMMWLAWCVALPALVAERRGVFDSFSRSADLTRNNRWRILGLFVVYIVGLIVVSAVIGIVVGIFSVVGAIGGFNPIGFVVNGVVNAAMSAIGATLIAVLYVELRRAREGSATGWLAEIFS